MSSLSWSVVSLIVSEKPWSEVRTCTTTLAAGAKAKAQIKTTTIMTAKTEPIIICVRYFLIFGTFWLDFFLATFLSVSASSSISSSVTTSSGFLTLTASTFLSSLWDFSWSDLTSFFSDLEVEVSGSDSSSIMSLSSSASPNSVSSSVASCGLLLRDFATGILTDWANLTRFSSVEIKTTVLLCWSAVLAINLKFTTLRSTPAFFGGTRATILVFAFLTLAIISVISSSGSI